MFLQTFACVLGLSLNNYLIKKDLKKRIEKVGVSSIALMLPGRCVRKCSEKAK